MPGGQAKWAPRRPPPPEWNSDDDRSRRANGRRRSLPRPSRFPHRRRRPAPATSRRWPPRQDQKPKRRSRQMPQSAEFTESLQPRSRALRSARAKEFGSVAARDVDAKVSIVDAAPSVPMSPGRAGFVSAAHSSVLVVEPMAMPIRIAPPVGAAGFRDFHDSRVAADDRRRHDCRAGGRGQTKRQRSAQDECPNHDVLPSNIRCRTVQLGPRQDEWRMNHAPAGKHNKTGTPGRSRRL